MIVLGISPLDKDAHAALVVDGQLVFAAGEERFTRVKQQAGFPEHAVAAALAFAGLAPGDIDLVAYPFLDAQGERAAIESAFSRDARFEDAYAAPPLGPLLAKARARIPQRSAPIHGLNEPNARMRKGALKEAFYRLASSHPRFSRLVARRSARDWAARAAADHRHWQTQLEEGLELGAIKAKLERSEHHLSHAANAYYASGYERALIVTLDGYGTGLAGSVSLGERGRIERLHGQRFPHSLGSFYEMVTSSLGFKPDRHAGKIVGLAAYGDPALLEEVLLSRVDRSTPGEFAIFQNLNVHLSRRLAAEFPVVDVAAAYQRVLEVLACEYVRTWMTRTGARNVVLSGGVAANVKMNQRIHELEGVEGLFVYPNMGDGGCGSGLAMHLSWPGGVRPSIEHVYLGPEFDEARMLRAIEAERLAHERPEQLAEFVARKLHEGVVVARFAGRMEYGPRALGNRSILYHGREPQVNQWLNQRLGRTEFMPFAPVTLWEAADKCYHRVGGAAHAAEFMTVTFDCTDFMKRTCPAAVHVDGTARPQLVRRAVNRGYYDILAAYERLSGSPSLINTSFNMHEEPIVCTPEDAVRAFVDGRIDALVMGPFYVTNPRAEARA